SSNGEWHLVTKDESMRQWSTTLKMDEAELPRWRELARGVVEAFAVELRQHGITPREAPPLPPPGMVEYAYIDEPYRVLCQYSLVNVIGYGPDRDEDGEERPVYGPPCFLLRVDTLG